jgi:predicted metal-dependent phosphoesterase TrpH
MKIDLHTHSIYSDGTLEPEDLVQKAAECGITHLALCDHDTTAGLQDALKASEKIKMNLIPGIEINTRQVNFSVHILGYFIDAENERLQKKLDQYRKLRTTRAQMMVDRLKRMGIKMDISDFNGRKEKSAIGRPHLADKLKELGVVFSRSEAFQKYLAKGKPGYVFYEGPTPKDALETILDCGGVPVLAHPGFFVSEKMIQELIGLGLQGLEVYYPSHSDEQVRTFLELAEKNNLIVTGGSDYHGPGSGHEELGEIQVPEKVLEKLQERKIALSK